MSKLVDDMALDSEEEEEEIEDKSDEYDLKDDFLVAGGESVNIHTAARKRFLEFDEDDAVNRPRKRLKTLARKEDEPSRSESFIVDDESSSQRKRGRDNFIVDEEDELDADTELVDSIFGYNLQELIEYESGKRTTQSMAMDDEDESEEEESGEEGDIEIQRTERKRYTKLRKLFSEEELKAKFLTRRDEEIVRNDAPERYQLQPNYLTRPEPTDENLEKEAKWIYNIMFPPKVEEKKRKLGLGGILPTPSSRGGMGMEDEDEDDDGSWALLGQNVKSNNSAQNVDESGFIHFRREDQDKLKCIEWVLKEIVKGRLEVPHLVFYKEDYFQSHFSEEELWRIVDLDVKYLSYHKMKEEARGFLLGKGGRPPAPPVYLELLREANSEEQVKDFFIYYRHFHLSPQGESTSTPEGEKGQIRQRRRRLKPKKKSLYTSARGKQALKPFLKLFGLSSREYAENLQQADTIHLVNDDETSPTMAAESYICNEFLDEKAVLKAARCVFAVDIIHEPVVIQKVRSLYECCATISVETTEKGERTNLPWLYEIKRFKKVPLHVFESDDEKLEMILTTFKAEKDGLIRIIFPEIEDELWRQVLGYESFYLSDKLSAIAQQWNHQRRLVMNDVKKRFHFEMQKLVRHKFLEKSKYVVGTIMQRVFTSVLIKGPYLKEISEADEIMGDQEEVVQKLTKHRVLCCCPAKDRREDTIFVMLSEHGALLASMKWCYSEMDIRNVVKPDPNRPPPPLKQHVVDQEKDLLQFIKDHEPDVVCVTTSGLAAISTKSRIEAVLKEYKDPETDEDHVPCYFVKDTFPTIYAKSLGSQKDFPTYTERAKLAISSGRYFNDPITEIGRLFDTENSVLAIKLHRLERMFRPGERLKWMIRAMVVVTNRVGVDFNRVLLYRHLRTILPFICGLGPRKAQNLCERISEQIFRRSDLRKYLGKYVYQNCCGFLKIFTARDEDEDSQEFFRLDRTRIHPQDYPFARKMCTDSLEVETPEEEDETEHEKYVERIMDNPGVLEELDIQAYAVSLEQHHRMKKMGVLLLAEKELSNPFKDPRTPRKRMGNIEVFYSLIGETDESFKVGNVVSAQVVNIFLSTPRRPFGYEEQNREKDEFDMTPYLRDYEVRWVKCRLDNGLYARVEPFNISDENKDVRITRDGLRFQVGDRVDGVILKVNHEDYSVELDLRENKVKGNYQLNSGMMMMNSSSGGMMGSNRNRSRRNRRALTNKKRSRKDQVARNINHPFYKNVDYEGARKYLSDKAVGECVIRPSYSRGLDYLCVTYKYFENKFVNLTVKENKKSSARALGKELEFNKVQKFSDIDELYMTLVQDVVDNSKNVMQHAKYVGLIGGGDTGGSKPTKEEEQVEARNMENRVKNILRKIKLENPKTIPYRITMNIAHPTSFFLHYLPAGRVLRESFQVVSDGYKFDNDTNRVMKRIEKLIDHFKKTYKAFPSYKRWSERRQREKRDGIRSMDTSND